VVAPVGLEALSQEFALLQAVPERVLALVDREAPAESYSGSYPRAVVRTKQGLAPAGLDAQAGS